MPTLQSRLESLGYGTASMGALIYSAQDLDLRAHRASNPHRPLSPPPWRAFFIAVYDTRGAQPRLSQNFSTVGGKGWTSVARVGFLPRSARVSGPGQRFPAVRVKDSVFPPSKAGRAYADSTPCTAAPIEFWSPPGLEPSTSENPSPA